MRVVGIGVQVPGIGGGLGVVVPIPVRCLGVHIVIDGRGRTLVLSNAPVIVPGILLVVVPSRVIAPVQIMLLGIDLVLGKSQESVHA